VFAQQDTCYFLYLLLLQPRNATSPVCGTYTEDLPLIPVDACLLLSCFQATNQCNRSRPLLPAELQLLPALHQQLQLLWINTSTGLPLTPQQLQQPGKFVQLYTAAAAAAAAVIGSAGGLTSSSSSSSSSSGVGVGGRVLSSWYVSQLLTLAATAKSESIIQMVEQKIASNSSSSSSSVDVAQLDVTLLDLLRLLRLRKQHDVAAAEWLARFEQQQQQQQEAMLLQALPPQQMQQQQQQWLGGFKCSLAGATAATAAAGSLYLTSSCLAFSTLFSSSSGSSSSTIGYSDTTKLLPLQSVLHVALVAPTAAAAVAAAAAADQQQQEYKATAVAAAAAAAAAGGGGGVSRQGTVSTSSSFCSLSEGSSEPANDNNNNSNITSAGQCSNPAASAAGNTATTRAANAASAGSGGSWLQLLSQSIKQWRSDTPASSATAAAAAVDVDGLALQLLVLVAPGVQEVVQFECFEAGQLQQLLLLLRQAVHGTGWQLEGSFDADAMLSNISTADAMQGTLLAGKSPQQQQQQREAKGTEHAALRCVACCLHGVLCNTPGKLLLFADRLVFTAAEQASPQQQQQPNISAGSSSSSSIPGGVLASMPRASVERVQVRQGWVGTWLVVAGGGRQLLLGGLQPDAAAALRAELLQRVGEQQCGK
jgi:hypothetical protein